MVRNLPVYLTVTGFLLVTIGFVCIWYAFPIIETFMIQKNIRLLPGNEAYKSWEKLPFPTKFKIYVFNLTNPQEVHDGNLPVFKEVGPYVYDEYRTKKIISTNETTDTVTYYNKRTFFFNKEDSMCLSEDDVVTVINAGLMTTAVLVEGMAPVALPMINDAIPYLFPNQKTIFMTGKVKDLLFDGMKMSCESEEVEMVCGAVKNRMPPTLRMADNNRDYLAAMFHHINGTWTGPFEVTRGSQTTMRGQILSYKNKSSVNKWASTFCNMMNGTDLSVLPPLFVEDKALYFFSEDFCRSFHARFDAEINFNGVESYRYVMEKGFQEENDDSCFCTEKPAVNPELPVCSPMGTMNIAPCVEAPIILSYPHFYLADPELLKAVQGLAPLKELHMTSIIAEPKTGTPLSLHVRFQMNIFLRKVDNIDILQNVTQVLIPIIWLEEEMDLPPNMISYLKGQLSKLKYLVGVEWFLIISGLVILSISLVLNIYDDAVLCFSKRKSSRIHAVNNVMNTKSKQSGDISTITYPSGMHYNSNETATENDSNSSLLRRCQHTFRN